MHFPLCIFLVSIFIKETSQLLPPFLFHSPKLSVTLSPNTSENYNEMTSRMQFTQCQRKKQFLTFQVLSSKGDDESSSSDNSNDQIEEDDDMTEKPYKTRSLSWTRQYRRLFSYETSRKAVLSLGLRSKEEWDEFVADGKRGYGPYLPNNPEEMYQDQWESWDEFLGVLRPYNETRYIVRHVLRLSSIDEYYDFIKKDPKRAEGLRIPAKPSAFYKMSGTWISYDHFFKE